MEWHTKKRLRGRGRGRLGWKISDNPRDNENIDQRNLEKEKPAEPHELVIAEPGQRPAHPHEDENEHRHFCKKSGDVEETPDYTAPAGRVPIDKGPVESAVPGRNRQMP